jgi:hypothetical protein
MSIVTLIIDSVLLFGVSVYGARVLPAGAQLPVHFGPGGTPIPMHPSSPTSSGT